MKFISLALSSLLLAAAAPAQAAFVDISHSAFVSFDSPVFSAPLMDQQTETAMNADPDRVQVGVGNFSFFNAQVDIRPNGAFAVDGFLFGRGDLFARVNIDAQVTTGAMETLIFDPAVIVDGGFLNTIDSANAELAFVWEVTARVEDENGVNQTNQFQEQQASGRIVYGPTQGPPTITLDPTNRLDMEINDFGDSLDIPFTVQRFDAPITLNPGWTLDIAYQVQIAASVADDGFTEGIVFQFKDPLTLDGSGPALNLNQVSASVVPLPAALPLLLSGLFGFALLRWRGRSAAAA